MKQMRGKRAYSILLFVIFAGVIFICFQFISFQVLNDDNEKNKPYLSNKQKDVHISLPKRKSQQQNVNKIEAATKYKPNKVKYEKDSEGDHAKFVPKQNMERNHVPSDRIDKIKQTDTEKKHVEKNKNVDIQPPDNIEVPLGVWRKDYLLYTPSASHMFTCTKTKVKIPFHQVNDDYCDCEDSSDEPGTSACPDGRFYCTFQLDDSNPLWITSSKVNDGICDCCDGSDEWEHNIPPPNVRRSGDQSWCKDNCNALKAAKSKEDLLRKEGSKLKLEYIEYGKGVKGAGEVYGPNAVFYKLSEQCYKGKQEKYTYNVCPFQKITQQDGHLPVVNIGNKSNWVSKSNGEFILEMSGGETANCPGRVGRKTIVTFICGIKDTVTNIHEDDRCVYQIKMTSPAAC